jgi:imidazole glycerol-phosphate synthase subunit HisF
MLKKRVIFTLLYDDGSFVLSRNFRLQRVGDLEWLKRHYNFPKLSFSIDELILLDVSRGEKNHEKFLEHVQAISNLCFIPISAGGGVKDVNFARSLVSNGADKIVINTLFGESSTSVQNIVSELGSQCVVASIDAKKVGNDFMVFTKNGTHQQDYSLKKWFQILEKIPVGEVYLNSIERDGTGQGYQSDLFKSIPTDFKLPIILAGGAGKYGHFIEGLNNHQVDAVATAHLFNFIGSSLEDSRNALFENGFDLAKWDIKTAESLRDFFLNK